MVVFGKGLSLSEPFLDKRERLGDHEKLHELQNDSDNFPSLNFSGLDGILKMY